MQLKAEQKKDDQKKDYCKAEFDKTEDKAEGLANDISEGVSEETTTSVHQLNEMADKGELLFHAISVNDCVTTPNSTMTTDAGTRSLMASCAHRTT